MSEEQAQNQEAVIESEESPEFQRFKTPLRRIAVDPMEEDVYVGDEQLSLTRSNAFMEPSQATRRAFAAKQPYMGYNRYLFQEDEPEEPSDNEEDEEEQGDFHDLAWFFRTIQPSVDKHSQIAWCRTFANSLAAMMPKNRPKTYKKAKTNEIKK